MSRPARIALSTLGILAGLAAILVFAGILVSQSQWFRGQVRAWLVREIETATGGRVETGVLRFDWRTMTASVRDLVIHGTETPDQAPLFRAEEIRLGIKILSVWERQVDLRALALVRPRINLIVNPDGATNVPEPRLARQARGNPLDLVFDLAIGQFSVSDGTIQIGFRKLRLDVAAEDFRAQVRYRRGLKNYFGEISLRHLNVQAGDLPALPFDFEGRFEFGRNRLSIEYAGFRLGGSYLNVHGLVEHFASPRSEMAYDARVLFQDLPPGFRTPGIPRLGAVALSGKAAYGGSGRFSATGKLDARGLDVDLRGVRIGNIGVASAFSVTPKGVTFDGLGIRALGGAFLGRAELPAFRNVQIRGELRGISANELVRLSGTHRVEWDGSVSGSIGLTAPLAKPFPALATFRADLAIARGAGPNPIEGLVKASYERQGDRLDFGPSHLATRFSRIVFWGAAGRRMDISAESTNLDDAVPVIAMFAAGRTAPMPVVLKNGVARFQGVIAGALRQPSMQGHFTIDRFTFDGHDYDSLDADAVLSSAGIAARNATVAKAQWTASGGVEIGLRDWQPDPGKPVSGTFSVRAANVAAAIAEAGWKIPGSIRGGPARANVKLDGTLGAPRVEAKIQGVDVIAFDQAIARLTGEISYTPGQIRVVSSSIRMAGGETGISGSYEYSKTDWRHGLVRFRVNASKVSLAEVNAVLAWDPGIGGKLDAELSGSAALTATGFRPGALDGSISLRGLALDGQPLGSLVATAATAAGAIGIRLDGDLAGSKIVGTSAWSLAGTYPAKGRIEFSALRFPSLLAHFRDKSTSQLPFDGFASGAIEFTGSPLDQRSWKGTVQLPSFEMRPGGMRALSNPAELALRNAGPILIDFDMQGARIREASLRAKDTSLDVTGSVSFGAKSPWDLRVRGGMDLALLRDYDARLYTSGSADLDVSFRGALSHPEAYGRIAFKDASVNFTGFPNGIGNANGVVFLYRDRATIDRFTAESGGGKIIATGFLGLGAATAYHVRVNASDVRVRYPAGISSTVDAALSLTGTAERSLVSGDVTVTRVGVNPRADLASILAASTSAGHASEPETVFERGMRFDVRIVTSPQVRFEASLTRDVRASADLRLRGAPQRPVLLGRILVNQGDISFFGSKYTITSGQIVFVNAARVEPIVNMDLETRVSGVDITLHLSGPVNKLNVTYRSDPPLPFSEIVGVLTTGREPSSPGSIGSQSQVSQSWQQAGATALLGQAISNPLNGRLQRFFGVSQFRIDPETGGSTTTNTAARVTVEQRIANNLSLTYVTDLSRAQAQSVRMELDLTRNWSAVALRDENGEFGVDVQYRKQFK